MAQVVLKIKIDLPGLRAELAEVIKEITTKLEPLGVLEFQGDTADLLKGLEDVTEEVNETDEAAGRTRNTLAQWGMILSGYQAMLSSIQQVWSVISKPVDVAGEFEQYNTQFEVLLGGIDKAEERIAELTDFAAKTPFEMPGIVKASLQLQNLTNGVLATTPGLTMIGDVAAGVNIPVEELSTWFGRLYDGIQNNRPVGEALMRLQELGALTGEARGEIEDLQKQNAESSEVWEVVTESMSKYNGMMQKQSENYLGLKSTASDVINLLVADFGNKLLPTAKEGTKTFIQAIESLRENLDEIVSTTLTVVRVMAPAITALVTYHAVILATAKAKAAYTSITATMAVVQKLWTVATTGSTIAQIGLNKAMMMNPIGAVITLVVGLVAVLGELTNWFGLTSDATDENTEANQENAQSLNSSADATSRLAKNLEDVKNIYNGLNDAQLRQGIIQLNKLISDTSHSEAAIAQYKQHKTAMQEMLQENIALANLSLKAKAEGQAKELEDLEIQIKELRNKWVDNAQAQNKIDQIAKAEREKIINKYQAREKRKIAKHAKDIQKLQIDLMEEGQAKELAKLKNKLDKQIASHKTDYQKNKLLRKKYDQDVAEIKEKYRQKEVAENIKQNDKLIKHAAKIQNLKIDLLEDGQEKEIAKLNLKYQKQYLKEYNNFAQLIILNRQYQLEKEAITKKFTDAEVAKTQAAIQKQKQQYQQFFQSFGNILTDALLHEQQYSNAQVQMQKDRHQKELQALKDSLAKGEITQKEYDLKRRIAVEDQTLYLKNVDKDRQTFTQNIADATYKKLISMGAEYLISYGAQKFSELMLEQSTETAKTAIAQEGTLARIALAGLEMVKKLALAAASVLAAIAEGIAYLFATMGPFALAAIPAMVGGVYALWNGIKSALGFREGGHTGYGNPNDVAGVVHKNEHVFESELVSKEPDQYAILHKMLRSGISLSQIFSSLTQQLAPPIVTPQYALAGVSLATPTISVNSSSNQSMGKIESLLMSMDKRLKNLESNPTVEEIKIIGEMEIKNKVIYIAFKKEEKLQKNRGIDVNK